MKMKSIFWSTLLLFLFVACSPTSADTDSVAEENTITETAEENTAPEIEESVEEMEETEEIEVVDEVEEIPEAEVEEENVYADLSQEEKDEALLTAVRDDDLAAVQALITAGADLDVIEPAVGFTPVTISIIRSNSDIFNALTQAGANISTIDNQGNTLLHHAATTNQVEIATVLLADGEIDLEHRRDRFGFTPLLAAAFEGQVEMVELLIEHGANIEAVDDWNDTAVNVAAWNGELAAIEKLIELGANPNVDNNNGQNALDHAKNQGHEEVEEFLATLIEDQ
ncbi:MAG: ankyrin repeat domain-containing protein [Chloroflexota bacterium]